MAWLFYLGGNIELSITLSRWMVGINWGNIDLFEESRYVINIFLGSVRIGWWAGARDFYCIEGGRKK